MIVPFFAEMLSLFLKRYIPWTNNQVIADKNTNHSRSVGSGMVETPTTSTIISSTENERNSNVLIIPIIGKYFGKFGVRNSVIAKIIPKIEAPTK